MIDFIETAGNETKVIKGANMALRGIIFYNTLLTVPESLEPYNIIYTTVNFPYSSTSQTILNKINSLEPNASIDFIYITLQVTSQPNTTFMADITDAITEKFPHAIVIDASTQYTGGRRKPIFITRCHVLRTPAYHLLDSTYIPSDYTTLNDDTKNKLNLLYGLTLLKALGVNYIYTGSNVSIPVANYYSGNGTTKRQIAMYVSPDGLIRLWFNAATSFNNEAIAKDPLLESNNLYHAGTLLYKWMGSLIDQGKYVTSTSYDSDLNTLYVSTTGSLNVNVFVECVYVSLVNTYEVAFPSIPLAT